MIILLNEAIRGVMDAALSRICHLTLADGLVVELSQAFPVRLEPIPGGLAIVVAQLFVISVLRVSGLTQRLYSAIEKA